MAWFALIGLGGLAISYVGSEAVDSYNNLTKPYYDWLEERKQRQIEEEEEERRQKSIDRIKKMYIIHDEIRTKYNIGTNKNKLTITNNSEQICTFIFVPKNIDDPIKHAQKLLKDDKLSKMTHKIIGVSNNIILITKEFEEYHVILHCDNKFIKIESDPLDFDKIKVKDLIKVNDNAIDVGCSKFSLFS
jgi:hypothetical protein